MNEQIPNEDGDSTVTINLPRQLALELAKYRDCYAPLLREVARSCDDALVGRD